WSQCMGIMVTIEVTDTSGADWSGSDTLGTPSTCCVRHTVHTSPHLRHWSQMVCVLPPTRLVCRITVD
ncbi:hypothetical protein KIPB_017133, partial [Kipferlia bialata]